MGVRAWCALLYMRVLRQLRGRWGFGSFVLRHGSRLSFDLLTRTLRVLGAVGCA